MSLAYFPMIYPDELMYSFLARIKVHSGYPSYIYAARDLLEEGKIAVDIEFISPINKEVERLLLEQISMDALIKRHTMFPYYARFITVDRKKRAYNAFEKRSGNYNNLLVLPKNNKGRIRCLRYCPICAKNDIDKYGETYWHRIHQLQGIEICSVHKCYLVETDVEISSKKAPNLKTAQESIYKQEIVFSKNELEHKLAQYIVNVFLSDIDVCQNNQVGKFLFSRLEETEYLSIRGKRCNITKLYDDLKKHYDLLGGEPAKIHQIQKIFTGYNVKTFDICQVAMYLGILENDLVKGILPEQYQYEKFDKKIIDLKKQGKNYIQIAKELHASVDVVKHIGENTYGIYNKRINNNLKAGKKAKDWERMDKELLPRVKKIIKNIYGYGTQRPKKVTKYSVCRALNLPSKSFEHLPLCNEEILKYSESQEQYWAREVIWAVNKILLEDDNVNWKKIRCLTNIRKENFQQCQYHIKDEKIKRVLEGI